MGSKQLLDHLELSHLHRVPVLLHLDVDAGQTELLLLEGVEDVVGDDSPHPVQLPGQLQLLDEGAADDGGGGSADASLQRDTVIVIQTEKPQEHLAVEDDGAGGGGVLQHRNDLVKVFLGGGLGNGCVIVVQRFTRLLIHKKRFEICSSPAPGSWGS